MVNWHIGCSGFHYKHWKGSFYPEKLAQSKWFSFYCEHFKTLELNVTFYRFPRLKGLESWYNNSPADFKFAVKAPKAITHYKKFNETEQMISSFYGTVEEGLKEKRGCYLFQLPPIYHYDEKKLERILHALDPGLPNVLEFRHESWWNESVFNALAAHGVSFCGMSHKNLPDAVVNNGPILYYRFHGKEQLYTSRYSKEDLQSFADCVNGDAFGNEAYVFFNNDINTSAVYNAVELQDMISL